MSAIDVRENLIDRMEVEISNYLIKLADQELGDDGEPRGDRAAQLRHRVSSASATTP